MDHASLIWNRAVDIFAEDLDIGGPGDRALAAMLLADGVIQNGGLLHGAESLDDAQFAAAVAGYRRFGVETVADELVRARAEIAAGALDDLDRAEALEFAGNDAYAAALGEDDALDALVRADIERNPGDYEPVD